MKQQIKDHFSLGEIEEEAENTLNDAKIDDKFKNYIKQQLKKSKNCIIFLNISYK